MDVCSFISCLVPLYPFCVLEKTEIEKLACYRVCVCVCVHTFCGVHNELSSLFSILKSMEFGTSDSMQVKVTIYRHT